MTGLPAGVSEKICTRVVMIFGRASFARTFCFFFFSLFGPTLSPLSSSLFANDGIRRSFLEVFSVACEAARIFEDDVELAWDSLDEILSENDDDSVLRVALAVYLIGDCMRIQSCLLGSLKLLWRAGRTILSHIVRFEQELGLFGTRTVRGHWF